MDKNAIEKVTRAFNTLLEKSQVLDTSYGKSFVDATKVNLNLYCLNKWPKTPEKIEIFQCMSASDGNTFHSFLGEEFADHPWHHHSQIIQQMSTNVGNM